MNYKRKRARRSVRCTLRTPHRWRCNAAERRPPRDFGAVRFGGTLAFVAVTVLVETFAAGGARRRTNHACAVRSVDGRPRVDRVSIE